MYDFLQPLKEFSKLNIPVKTAMQNDVNGIAWCMPDYFKNTGVRYLIMGINVTRSILPFDKPTAFWWEAPSGSRLLAFRADHYMTGNYFGIESKAIRPENMLWHLADLDDRGYPFDRIGIQYSGYRTDNAPPSTAACELVKQWNEKYDYPKLEIWQPPENLWNMWRRILLISYLFTAMRGSTGGRMAMDPHRAKRAEVRRTQNLKQVDEGLFTMVSMMGGELSESLEANLDHISENAIFFDEHTCGARNRTTGSRRRRLNPPHVSIAASSSVPRPRPPEACCSATCDDRRGAGADRRTAVHRLGLAAALRADLRRSRSSGCRARAGGRSTPRGSSCGRARR